MAFNLPVSVTNGVPAGVGTPVRPPSNPVMPSGPGNYLGAPQPTPSLPQQGGGGNFFSNLSPQAQAALLGGGMNILGGVLSGAGQAGQNEADRDLQLQILAQQLAMQKFLAEQQLLQRQREVGVETAQATPNRQDWRQRQALMADVLPQLRNVKVNAPGDLGRFMPQIEGGMRLPEGGFSPEALAFFSPEARAGAEADLDRAGAMAAGGQYATPNYGRAGYGGAAAGLDNEVTNYADQIRQQALASAPQGQAFQNIVGRAQPTRTEQIRQQQQSRGSGMGSRLAQAALGAGMGYLGSRWGGGGNPWLNAAMGAAGGFF